MNYGRAPWSHVILKSKACTKINLSGHPGVYALITVSYLFFRGTVDGPGQNGDLQKCKMAIFTFAFVQRIREKLVGSAA